MPVAAAVAQRMVHLLQLVVRAAAEMAVTQRLGKMPSTELVAEVAEVALLVAQITEVEMVAPVSLLFVGSLH